MENSYKVTSEGKPDLTIGAQNLRASLGNKYSADTIDILFCQLEFKKVGLVIDGVKIQIEKLS
jgi:hypothetical protein